MTDKRHIMHGRRRTALTVLPFLLLCWCCLWLWWLSWL